MKKHMTPATVAEAMPRVQSRIQRDANGCHIWLGSINIGDEQGYPVMQINGHTRLVHRVVYQHAHGPVPIGLEVDHKCRVRRCVNVEHLEAVTHAENNRRKPYGATRKLTLSQVDRIRYLRIEHRMEHAALATLFGVTAATICSILNWEAWS